jgi:hypothetical protein
VFVSSAIMTLFLFAFTMLFATVEDMTFGTALYMTVIIFTSVGLGDVTPVTVSGKVIAIVCIFWSLAGGYLLLSHVVLAILSSFKKLAPRKVFLLSITAGMVIAASLVFSFLENWSILHSLYFVAGIVSTVGLGEPSGTISSRFATALLSLVGSVVFSFGLSWTLHVSSWLDEERLKQRLLKWGRRSKLSEQQFVETMLTKLGKTNTTEISLLKEHFRSMSKKRS